MPRLSPAPGTTILQYKPHRLPVYHDSDSDDDGYSDFRIRLLDRDTYLQWICDVQDFLTLSDSSDALEDPPPAGKDLKALERNALFVLQSTMSPLYRKRYTTGEYEKMTAAQLWKAIRIAEREHMSPLIERTKLSTIYLENYRNPTEYMTAIRLGRRRLQFAKSTEETDWEMPADEFVFLILNGLPRDDDWNPVRTNVLVSYEKVLCEDPQKLEDMLRRVFPLTALGEQREREEEVRKKRLANTRCYKCNKKGHLKRDCRA